MTLSYWLDAHNEKVSGEVDIAIVGGGIMGASAAFWLGKRKDLKVALLEGQDVGCGASGRSGGLVLRGIVAYYNQAVRVYGRQTTREIFQLNEETLRHLSELVRLHGNTFQYEQCGSYLLACSLEELQSLEESAQLMSEDGFEAEYLRQDPIRRDYYGALFNPSDAGVHPVLLIKTLLDLSRVSVFERESVYRLEPLSSGGVLVHTPCRVLKCGLVLLATNAYAPLLEPWFLPKLQAVRGQILVTRPLKKRILDRLCYANYGFEYFRQLADNRLLLGGCRQPFRLEEVGYADMVTQPVQSALKHYLKDRFPDVAGIAFDYRWSGTMAFTSDGLPLIGQLPELPDVYFAVGCNGHGLGYSLSIADLLVRVALDSADPGVFAVNRSSSFQEHVADSSAEKSSFP